MENLKDDHFTKMTFTQEILEDENVLAKPKVSIKTISPRKGSDEISSTPSIEVQQIQTQKIDISSSNDDAEEPPRRSSAILPKTPRNVVDDEQIDVELKSDESPDIDIANAFIETDLESLKNDNFTKVSFTQEILEDEKILAKPKVTSRKHLSLQKEFNDVFPTPSIEVQQVRTQKIDVSSNVEPTTKLSFNLPRKPRSIVDDEEIIDVESKSDDIPEIDLDGSLKVLDPKARITTRVRINSNRDDKPVSSNINNQAEIKPVTAQTIITSSKKHNNDTNKHSPSTMRITSRSTTTYRVKSPENEDKVDAQYIDNKDTNFDLHHTPVNKTIDPQPSSPTKRREFQVIYKYEDLIDDKTSESAPSPTSILNETASSPSHRRKTFTDDNTPGEEEEESPNNQPSNKSTSVSVRVNKNQKHHVSFADQPSPTLSEKSVGFNSTSSPGRVTVSSSLSPKESYIDLDDGGSVASEDIPTSLDDDKTTPKEKKKSMKSKAKKFVLRRLSTKNNNKNQHHNNGDNVSVSSVDTITSIDSQLPPLSPKKDRRSSTSSIKRFGSTIKSKMAIHKKHSITEEEADIDIGSSHSPSSNFILSSEPIAKKGFIGIQKLKYDDDGTDGNHESVKERSKRFNRSIDDVDHRLSSSTNVTRPTMFRSRSYDSMLDTQHKVDGNTHVVVKGRDYSTAEAIYRETESELAYIRQQRRKKLFPEYSQSIGILDQQETEKKRANEARRKEELEKMRQERVQQMKKKKPSLKKKPQNKNSMDVSLNTLNKIKSVGHVRIPNVFQGLPRRSSSTSTNPDSESDYDPSPARRNSGRGAGAGGSPMVVGKLRIPRAFSNANLLDIDDGNDDDKNVGSNEADVRMKVTGQFDI